MELILHFGLDNNLGSTNEYRLLELPADIYKMIESSDSEAPSLSIRGRQGDDSVLCTKDTTYVIRNVLLSNTYCIVTPPRSRENGDAIIRYNVHEVLEIQRTIPRLHRLRGLLKGCELTDCSEIYVENDVSSLDSDSQVKKQIYTYEDARSDLQASDTEFDLCLKRERILILDGRLRPISPPYLQSILILLVDTLVSLMLDPASASVDDLLDALEGEHEIPRAVALQVMSWFGNIIKDPLRSAYHGANWKINIECLVKEIGLGILREHRENGIPEDEFIMKWCSAVGDKFQACVALPLLVGDYILSTGLSYSAPNITYFPSSELPIEAADRFTDLFLTQSSWKASDISPFLNDITVDEKERDKLLIRYARSTTDKDGTVWYTARGAVTS